MRLSFYLDKPDTDRSVVMLNLSFRGHRLRLGTGISLEPKHWNANRQEPKPSSPSVNQDRRRLLAIAEFIREAFDTFRFGDKKHAVTTVDIAAFKEQLSTYLTPEAITQGVARSGDFAEDFSVFIDTYTIRSSSGMITTRRPGASNILLYKRTLASLIDWSKYAKRSLGYETIDEAFYGSYCSWLATNRGLTDVSAGNYIKTIKTFMKWAKQKEYHSTTTYETFHREVRTGDTIALTVDELRRIRDLDLKEHPRLARTRDIFLLQCYTGMRYGDMVRLEPRHFDETAGLIRYTSQKSDTACIVPITRPLAELLKGYPSLLFEFPSDVKQNKYIKEVAALAGMNQSVTISTFMRGKRVEEVLRRDQVVTTHVARRTFVTTSLRFNVPEAVISAVTGHAAKGMLQHHYVKFDEEGIREIVCRAWELL